MPVERRHWCWCLACAGIRATLGVGVLAFVFLVLLQVPRYSADDFVDWTRAMARIPLRIVKVHVSACAVALVEVVGLMLCR
jgi:hypothetical protein